MITNEQINEIVRKIAEAIQPDKIILFGSYARGDYNEDSDLDFIFCLAVTELWKFHFPCLIFFDELFGKYRLVRAEIVKRYDLQVKKGDFIINQRLGIGHFLGGKLLLKQV